GEQRGAHRRGGGPGRERCGDRLAARDPAGGDERQVGRARNLPQQAKGRERLSGLREAGALVAPGLAALNDQRVRTDGGCDTRLVRGGNRAPDGAAGSAERLDDLALGAAERERDDGRRLARGELELRVPLIVRPARFAGLDAEALRFR